MRSQSYRQRSVLLDDLDKGKGLMTTG